jgi:hypothetical protein
VDAAFHLLRGQALVALGRPEEASVAMQNYVHMRNIGTGDAQTTPTKVI